MNDPLLKSLVALVEDYLWAPKGIASFRWVRGQKSGAFTEVFVPKRAPMVGITTIGQSVPEYVEPGVRVRIYRDVEDRHGGVKFSVGWSAEARVGVIWIEE